MFSSSVRTRTYTQRNSEGERPANPISKGGSTKQRARESPATVRCQSRPTMTQTDAIPIAAEYDSSETRRPSCVRMQRRRAVCAHSSIELLQSGTNSRAAGAAVAAEGAGRRRARWFVLSLVLPALLLLFVESASIGPAFHPTVDRARRAAPLDCAALRRSAVCRCCRFLCFRTTLCPLSSSLAMMDARRPSRWP